VISQASQRDAATCVTAELIVADVLRGGVFELDATDDQGITARGVPGPGGLNVDAALRRDGCGKTMKTLGLGCGIRRTSIMSLLRLHC